MEVGAEKGVNYCLPLGESAGERGERGGGGGHVGESTSVCEPGSVMH